MSATFTLSRQALNDTLSLCSKVVAKRNIELDVHKNILLTVQEGRLYAVVANSKMIMSKDLGEWTGDAFDALLPFDKVIHIVSLSKKESVKFVSDTDKWVIHTHGKYTIAADPDVEAFASWKNHLNLTTVLYQGPLSDFSVPFSKVSFATTVDYTRPVLSGVKWLPNGFSASDSFKLAHYSSQTGPDSDLLIPDEAVEVVRSAFDRDAQVEIGQGSTNLLLFKSGPVSFGVRLLEGNYPDLKGIIDSIAKNYDKQIQINRIDFHDAIKRCSICGGEGNRVTLTCSSEEIGIEANSTVEIAEETVRGVPVGPGWPEPVEITTDARYLMEVLNQLNSIDILISFHDGSRPFQLSEIDNPDLQILLGVMRRATRKEAADASQP